MLSTEDLERLITRKRREIEQEKTELGLSEHNSETEKKAFRPRAFSESNAGNSTQEEEVSPELERYIRRYIGLPGMLKAGEYSPNNPLIREERSGGDVLRALGEYERRRNTLRKIRQKQYKEYLDQQAKKKQEAKEQAEREQREKEEKERLREERERERLEREKSPAIRSVSVVTNDNYVTKVDTAVQVDKASSPLSVAVQTEGQDIISFRTLTQAERELSPRSVELCGRRRSYGDFDNRTRVTSVFDEDTVRMRNMQAEKEALERRQYYQQELRNQIIEQQRIRDERKNREKMLEQAEMRRLEEHLRSLKMAQERDRHTHRDRQNHMLDHALEYEKKRSSLQKDIDYENHLLKIHRHTRSESPKLRYREDKPFSTNIPDDSIFSPNYDVDSYLRRNLNPQKDFTIKDKKERNIHNQRKDNVIKDKAVIQQKSDFDTLPIPVLRHSPRLTTDADDNTDMSEKMKIIDDKWKVPAIQKNILKSLNDKGKNVSILTQLGSIRRQLQLEQMKLDKLTNN